MPDHDDTRERTLREALDDAATYLRLGTTWIADTDRHLKMKRAWEQARAALAQADQPR